MWYSYKQQQHIMYTLVETMWKDFFVLWGLMSSNNSTEDSKYTLSKSTTQQW